MKLAPVKKEERMISARALRNEPSVAKVGVDTMENRPSVREPASERKSFWALQPAAIQPRRELSKLGNHLLEAFSQLFSDAESG